jgi:hypothetical protein
MAGGTKVGWGAAGRDRAPLFPGGNVGWIDSSCCGRAGLQIFDTFTVKRPKFDKGP